MTKHHRKDTAVVNGEWDFQIPKVNVKKYYKQIKCVLFI